MPHISVTTNMELNRDVALELAKKCSTLCAGELGKPEQYVQAMVRGGAALVHGGTDDPAAYVELKSIGLDGARAPELSKVVCGLLKAELGVEPARIYLEFKDLERSLFGWNSTTF